MADIIRVIQYGLGPIGAATARLVHDRSGLELAAGIDIDPAKVGEDVGSIIGLDSPLGFQVVKSIDDLDDEVQADVVMHTTHSYFSDFQPQILEILGAGYDIVSTAEELSFPWLSHAEQGAEIDAAAKKAGKTVLGTGVNPGFLMDFLPIGLTGICQHVERMDVRRVINASTRREPFQLKIGSGLSVEEFRQRMETGKMGHAGLPESAHMVLHSLGRNLESYESSVEPVIAEKLTETEFLSVEPGRVIGLQQEATVRTKSGEFLTMAFIAALDAEDEKDTITIIGKPDLEMTLRGTNGDLATVAMAVNAVPRVVEAGPGLITMVDLPVVMCRE